VDRRRLTVDKARSRPVSDVSVTGYESSYFYSLMQSACELMVVLREGDQIVGRLAWYDQACLKITPSAGTPSLVIPKESIKYLYELSAPGAS
jgi:hypothetical protein